MNKKDENILSEEFIKACGLTVEEVADLEAALALADTVEMLPENEDKLFDKIEKTIPNNIDEGLDVFADLCNKDPKFFAQLVALAEINDVVSEAPAPTTTKLSKDDLLDARAHEILNSL